MDRVMIFHPCENGRFVNSNIGTFFNWTGDYIGEISGFISKIPAVKGNNLYFVNGLNQYVILKKYNTRTHIIEMIKRIYQLPIIPYNLCNYKNRAYFVYLYTPFNEIEYTLWKRKKDEITDGERIIFFLHWILGVRGKIVRAYINGSNSDSIILSNGSYSEIDYSKNDITQAKISRYFDSYTVFQSVGSFFYDEVKIQYIRDLMNDQNYWWFQEIERRIKSNFIKLEKSERFTHAALCSSYNFNQHDFTKYKPYLPECDDEIVSDNVISEMPDVSPHKCYALFQQPGYSSNVNTASNQNPFSSSPNIIPPTSPLQNYSSPLPNTSLQSTPPNSF